MMLDDLEPNESRANEQTARRPSDAPAPAQRPVSDREVPLTGRTAMADIHAWLDGDLPETAVRRADTAHDIEFWNRLEKDVEVRRQMKTPVPKTGNRQHWLREEAKLAERMHAAMFPGGDKAVEKLAKQKKQPARDLI